MVAAAVVALAVYIISGLTAVALYAFIFGACLDVDHFLDFLLWSKPRDLRRFFSQAYSQMPHVTDIILHSYELLPIVWMICLFLQRFDLAAGFTVGFLTHMVGDEVENRKLPVSYYFFTSRFFMKKRLAVIFEEVKRRNNYRCVRCGGEVGLEIHSLRGFSYSPDDYIPLCHPCHAKEHGRKPFIHGP